MGASYAYGFARRFFDFETFSEARPNAFTTFRYSKDNLGTLLNEIACNYNLPTFPAASPYVLAIGGLQYKSSWLWKPDVPFTYVE